ncbi:hypothetical protein SAMN05216474_0336 [Lishizhenia tianjinensis]|uniref:Uncharacterized protein n=1 Tax=Lishizhenia tianjinensis TaxID=477690 RepID=A0A1I6XNS6_9FLAO|nr:DUF2262 domain-containing protein [Lishizhenia tianjinensis]SFT39806.1 hypothetical protein SAMN05216474_0336 [Lishizhenia tianjinensis]
MKLYFFNKKKNGWELPDLLALLEKKPSKLEKYSKSYALSALNLAKDRFVIIRKYAAREMNGKIEMLNAHEYYDQENFPLSQYGMTLISISEHGASSQNIFLPNSLKYAKLSMDKDTITLHHTKGTTTTNYEELHKLGSIENLTQKEILNRFNTLQNYKEAPQHNDNSKVLKIEDNFFGCILYNEELDWYTVTKDRIKYSFKNTTMDQLKINIKNTQNIAIDLEDIESKMIAEMLPYVYETHLANAEEFKKQIRCYGVTIFEDGSAHLYYKVNDLFGDHEIQVTLNPEHAYFSADTVG